MSSARMMTMLGRRGSADNAGAARNRTARNARTRRMGSDLRSDAVMLAERGANVKSPDSREPLSRASGLSSYLIAIHRFARNDESKRCHYAVSASYKRLSPTADTDYIANQVS